MALATTPPRPDTRPDTRTAPRTELEVHADLQFSLELPGERTVTGALSGSGRALDLSVSDPFAFAGRRDARSVRGVAEALAAAGLSVTVRTPRGPLVTLGAPRTPWWQRRVTGSRHIRIERGAGLWSLARGRARATAGALPSYELVPPPTLWPPVPTLLRRRRRVTTTHDRPGGGNPRLVVAPREHPGADDPRRVFRLRGEVTSIGSAPDCDVRLPGLAPRHAEIRHDARDEYVLVRLGEADTRVNGAPVDAAVLRTASRLQLGDWTLSFFREEYADHGRPHGGRLGGELGRQQPQPPRSGGPAPQGDWSGRRRATGGGS
jgi:hypothetical protein